MSDIVEKLRKYAKDWSYRAGDVEPTLLAISEIERLRSSLSDNYERGRRDMAKEVFALHEDTVDHYHAIAERDQEGKQGAFARGRITEAKSIAKAIGAILPATAPRS